MQETVVSSSDPVASTMASREERLSAVVTGASSGIGRGIALRLAREGLHVLCCDLEPTRQPVRLGPGLEKPTHLLATERGGSADFVHCDVRSEADLERVASVVRDSRMPLRAAVINAGIFPGPRSILDDDLEHHRRVMQVNEEGAWLTCRALSKVMVEQELGGRIVFTGSVAALTGEMGASSYCSSKGAVVSLTRAVALDLAAYGITVNAVCPGWVDTPLNEPYLNDPKVRAEALASHPLGRFGTPEDIAGAVAFLVSDEAAWITGVALPVDGGFTCR